MLTLLLACTLEGGPGTLVTADYGWYLPFGSPNTDEAWGIAQDPATGDIFVATHQGAPRSLPDLYVYRLTADGEVLWQMHWGSTPAELAYVLTYDNGTLYVGGQIYRSGVDTSSSDALILALEAETGAPKWEWSYDGGLGYDAIEGLWVDGKDLYLSGWSTTEKGNDILLGSLSTDGDELWVSAWGTDRWDEANGHLVGDDQNLYVAGIQDGSGLGQGGNAMVAAFSRKDGSLVWNTLLDDNTAIWDDALGLAKSGDGLYAVGSQAGGSFDLRIWGLNTSGTLAWDSRYGGSGGETGRSLAVDGDRLQVAFNTTSEGQGDSDLGLLDLSRVDGSGDRTFLLGGSGHEEVHDLLLSSTATFLVGQSDSVGAGKEDGLLIRVDDPNQEATLP